MDMTWERLILLYSLSKKRPKNTFQAQLVPTTGDGARAPLLKQHSISTFLGHPVFRIISKTPVKYQSLNNEVTISQRKSFDKDF